jgi:hypothetical protein
LPLYSAIFDLSAMAPFGLLAALVVMVAPLALAIGVYLMLDNFLPRPVVLGNVTALRKAGSETVPEFFVSVQSTEVQVHRDLFPRLRQGMYVALQINAAGRWVTAARAMEPRSLPRS